MILALPLIPFFAAFLLLFIPSQKENLLKFVSIAASGICLTITLLLFASFNHLHSGFQYKQTFSWFSELGIHYQVGMDGMSLAFCLLHALIAFASSFVAIQTKARLKEYLFYSLIFIGSGFAVFTALNIFFIYLFYEITLIPLFLMVGIGGIKNLKEQGSIKIAIYMTLGAVLALFALFSLYNIFGPRFLDLTQLKNLALSHSPFLTLEIQKYLAAFLIIGFGMMTSLWPFHSWSPSAYAAMPPSLAMLHAGVKMGPYILIRIAMSLLPAGFYFWTPTLSILGTIGILYGGFAAIRQKDLKLMGAFSSISHMGYIFLALAAMNQTSLSAAIFLLFAHGLIAACFFALVGHLHSQTQLSGIYDFGGLGKSMPFFSVCFMATCLASAGIPGFAGFPGELLVFVGSWKSFPIAVSLGVVGVLITAIYSIRAAQAVCFGAENNQLSKLCDIKTISEKMPFVILIAALLFFGIWPKTLFYIIQPAIGRLL